VGPKIGRGRDLAETAQPEGGQGEPTKRVAETSNLVVFLAPSTVRPLDYQDRSVVSLVGWLKATENLGRDLDDG
jgi:hypothetical protein